MQLVVSEHWEAYKVLKKKKRKKTTFMAHAFPVKDNGYISP